MTTADPATKKEKTEPTKKKKAKTGKGGDEEED